MIDLELKEDYINVMFQGLTLCQRKSVFSEGLILEVNWFNQIALKLPYLAKE